METATILETSKIPSIEREKNPDVTQADPPYPNTNQHGVSSKHFVEEINNIYNGIICWRKNLFKVPTGKAGRSFTYNRGM